MKLKIKTEHPSKNVINTYFTPDILEERANALDKAVDEESKPLQTNMDWKTLFKDKFCIIESEYEDDEFIRFDSFPDLPEIAINFIQSLLEEKEKEIVSKIAKDIEEGYEKLHDTYYRIGYALVVAKIAVWKDHYKLDSLEEGKE